MNRSCGQCANSVSEADLRALGDMCSVVPHGKVYCSAIGCEYHGMMVDEGEPACPRFRGPGDKDGWCTAQA